MNWSNIKKNDILYLMIPYEEDGIIKYEYQESYVINTNQYDVCTNIRLKYTDKNINKRRRINLCINKEKYDNKYLAYCKETSWARDYYPKWGDLIITYDDPNNLNEAYTNIINNKINEISVLIKSYKIYLEKIEDIRFNKIV